MNIKPSASERSSVEALMTGSPFTDVPAFGCARTPKFSPVRQAECPPGQGAYGTGGVLHRGDPRHGQITLPGICVTEAFPPYWPACGAWALVDACPRP